MCCKINMDWHPKTNWIGNKVEIWISMYMYKMFEEIKYWLREEVITGIFTSSQCFISVHLQFVQQVYGLAHKAVSGSILHALWCTVSPAWREQIEVFSQCMCVVLYYCSRLFKRSLVKKFCQLLATPSPTEFRPYVYCSC